MDRKESGYMKLYATVSSERATKGQGGNNHLEITLKAGEKRETILSFSVIAPDDKSKYVTIRNIQSDGVWIMSHFHNHYNDILKETYNKGERQKGE